MSGVWRIYGDMSEFPEEMKFLALLHNIGAISPDRSLSVDEIARWAGIDSWRVKERLLKLRDERYIDIHVRDNVEKYYLTINGIRKVLSIYS